MYIFLRSLLLGAALATSGVLLHNAFPPFGLILSLLALLGIIRFLAKSYRGNLALVIFMIGWILVLVRASFPSDGGEVLVQGNMNGNIYFTAGLIFIFIAVIKKPK